MEPFPASAEPSRIENSGITRRPTTASPASPAVHGRRWITRLHRNHSDVRPGRSNRESRGSRNRSMFRPANPRTAGRSVIEASIVTNTAAAPPTAIPWTKSNPISRMPRNDTTTTIPANTTARPDVVMASAVASSGSSPSRSPARYRVTMNSA